MKNLLEETEKALNNHNLGLRNAKFAWNREGYTSIAEFAKSAMNFNYDEHNGEQTGRVCVDPCLKIVGVTWWLDRVNYRGHEGWAFRKKPLHPDLPAVDFKVSNRRSGTSEDSEKDIEE